MNAGNLYGTTISGGYVCGCGTIFELSPSGGSWTETLIYPFKGGSEDGAAPYSPLVFDAQGNFYGTTYSAGAGFGVSTKNRPSKEGIGPRASFISFRVAAMEAVLLQAWCWMPQAISTERQL